MCMGGCSGKKATKTKNPFSGKPQKSYQQTTRPTANPFGTPKIKFGSRGR